MCSVLLRLNDEFLSAKQMMTEQQDLLQQRLEELEQRFLNR